MTPWTLADLLAELAPQPWMRRAACKHTNDPDAWHPRWGGRHHPRTSKALRTCENVCPVVRECLAYAMAEADAGRPVHGIWGGTTDRLRRRMRTKQGKANP
jgi:hypothetical protein